MSVQNPVIRNVISNSKLKEFVSAADDVADDAAESIDKAVEKIDKAVDSIWDYKLLTVDRNTITVGNLLVATIFLLIGIWYFGKIKAKLRNYLNKKLDHDKDAANAVENILSYILAIVFVTIVLHMANIPLSTFAFVGGALALGVGLGAQNLINNFMSSLIIMIEKPVKIGDTIEVDKVQGKVVSIGSRCITIQTSGMTDVLIPNSKIIQETLTNWSLMDNYTKAFIDIKFYKNKFCKLGKELAGSTPCESDNKNNAKLLDQFDDSVSSPDTIISKLKEIFLSFPELNESSEPEIYYYGPDNFYYNYQVVFVFDTKKITNISSLRTYINLEMSRHFDFENLVIEYNS